MQMSDCAENDLDIDISIHSTDEKILNNFRYNLGHNNYQGLLFKP